MASETAKFVFSGTPTGNFQSQIASLVRIMYSKLVNASNSLTNKPFMSLANTGI